MVTERKGLMDRLAEGPVTLAEGYLFELERRGHLQAGAFVPEVVAENPDAVRMLTREFLAAGSDIALALTYYAHREKMRLIGREDELEPMNRAAIRLARDVAHPFGALVAGDLSNTNIYDPDDADSVAAVRQIFREQVAWAVDEGVDLIVAETLSYAGEAVIALEEIKAAAPDMPAVVNLSFHRPRVTREDWTVAQSFRRLEEAGADVIGLNCQRGPQTMLPLLAEARDSYKGHLAALPVPYRTDDSHPTFQSLDDPGCSCAIPGGRPFPVALDALTCNRYEIAAFTAAAKDIGVTLFGLCCGAAPHHMRAMAEALGRMPPASRYSADMSKHFAFGSVAGLKAVNTDYVQNL